MQQQTARQDYKQPLSSRENKYGDFARVAFVFPSRRTHRRPPAGRGRAGGCRWQDKSRGSCQHEAARRGYVELNKPWRAIAAVYPQRVRMRALPRQVGSLVLRVQFR